MCKPAQIAGLRRPSQGSKKQAASGANMAAQPAADRHMVNRTTKTLAGAKGVKAAPSSAHSAADTPFWRKPLAELSKSEWEALCDGCGRCCLVKLEDEDTGKIHYTDIACNLFESRTCQCTNYPERQKLVPDCVNLTRANVTKIPWLPPTCAYRLRAEGRDLYWWHYLVSGSRQSVHSAGISARGRTGPKEDEIALDDYPSRIVRWPGNAPAGRGKPEKGKPEKGKPEKG